MHRGVCVQCAVAQSSCPDVTPVKWRPWEWWVDVGPGQDGESTPAVFGEGSVHRLHGNKGWMARTSIC